MKKVIKFTLTLVSLLALSGCTNPANNEKEPFDNEKMPYTPVKFQAGKVMEIMPLAPCDAGTEGVYIIANDSTSGTVLINDYFENETKKSDGTSDGKESLGILQDFTYKYDSESGFMLYNSEHSFMQFIEYNGKPCIIAEPLFYCTSYGESSYYFKTKDLKYSLCLYREGDGTLDAPSNSGQKITWTNTEGVVKITYENGQSDSFNWYDNDMLCLTSCIIPCKYVDEITVATSIIYSTYTGIGYKYKKNYLSEALRILPTEMKKTIILCGYDKNTTTGLEFSDNIIDAIESNGQTQKNVHLVVDTQYKNYYPYKLRFNDGTTNESNCIVSFRIDATDVTLDGDEKYEIGDNCFSQWKSLKEVYISDNYNVIGENAFSGCTALEKVEFGDPWGWKIADETGDNPTDEDAGITENASLLKNGNVKFLHD